MEKYNVDVVWLIDTFTLGQLVECLPVFEKYARDCGPEIKATAERCVRDMKTAIKHKASHL